MTMYGNGDDRNVNGPETDQIGEHGGLLKLSSMYSLLLLKLTTNVTHIYVWLWRFEKVILSQTHHKSS